MMIAAETPGLRPVVMTLIVITGMRFSTLSRADPPATSYLFPAGGQVGKDVNCRVGTLNCAHECGFRLHNPLASDDIAVPNRIARVETLVLTGPYHQNPVAQQPWDYPKDMSATLIISDTARPGLRHWYCTTSEGSTALRPFVVGTLPEVVENERHTNAGQPQQVSLPMTVNGRIFPRADLDEYRFSARAGDIVSCDVVSHRLGHKLDALLQLRDSSGQLICEADNHVGPDPLLITRVPADGDYILRINDIAFEGGQDYVYRLSLRTGPCVTHIFPAGANPANETSIRLHGYGLGRDGHLDASISGTESGGWTMPDDVNVFCPFLNSDIDEVIEVETTGISEPQLITLPAVINGRVQSRQDIDIYRLTLHQQQEYTFEVFGRRLRSPVTAVITVRDPSGNEVARHEGDGLLRLAAQTNGEHTLEVRELFHETHAGDDYIYRITARSSPPDFELRLSADRLNVQPGGTATLKLQLARHGGFKEDVRLEAESLPVGVTFQEITLAADQTEAELTLTAARDAPIGVTQQVQVIGRAVINETPVAHSAVWLPPTVLTMPLFEDGSPAFPAVDRLSVTVAHPQVFAITTTDVYGSANRGATLVQTHHLERLGDFDGPVEISLSDGQDRYLQGVTGPTMILERGETEFDYPAFLPETMDLNRTARMVVMGTARVTDSSGRNHFVTHRTKNQMVVRVCPSLLTLGADESYFEGTPGATVNVPLRVGRTAEITGNVTLQADFDEDAPVDSPQTLQVAPDIEQVSFRLRLADGASPGDTCEVRLRATGLRQGYPAMAETKVEIQVVDTR